jgi:diaminohydroxyphosphoribosylaminopyrimidine deaminase / 5-amino-6-(5-phosphoribosylamino)uracil reductase
MGPPATTDRDRRWMRRALDLALRAAGRTAPNPVVGAVLVRGNDVVGEGWHVRAGAPHAERVALDAAGESARGAELFVTLEPCAHVGRTPPCAPAVAEAGVARVVAAMEDPDPRTRGKGFVALRDAGVPVDVGVLAAEAERANEAFVHRVRTGLPLGVLKAAVTLDGRLAADGGDSRWITGEAARERAHELRDTYDAVLVGRGTLEADDPSLDVRIPGDRRDPVAVVVDTNLSCAGSPCRLLARAEKGARVVVAGGESAPDGRRNELERRGAEVVSLPVDAGGRVDLRALFAALAARGMNSVMVEGGGKLHTACLSAGLIGRAHVFVAPILLGGDGEPRWIGNLGTRSVADGLRLRDVEHEILGEDLLVTGRVASGSSPTRSTGSAARSAAPAGKEE